MTEIEHFQAWGPIPEESIQQFEAVAPEGLLELWREKGRGAIGELGFIRLVDPARAANMVRGIVSLPEGSVVVGVTALADLLVVLPGNTWAAIKYRWKVIDPLPPGVTLDAYLDAVEDPGMLQDFFQWDVYPQAVERLGIPGEDRCFGYVPLLALGGRMAPESLEEMGLWEHMMLNVQLAGPPTPRQAAG